MSSMNVIILYLYLWSVILKFQNPNHAFETAELWCIVHLTTILRLLQTILRLLRLLHFSLICTSYCGLVKKGWALTVAVQFVVWGLVAYNLVAYKKNKCISLHIIVDIYF